MRCTASSLLLLTWRADTGGSSCNQHPKEAASTCLVPHEIRVEVGALFVVVLWMVGALGVVSERPGGFGAFDTRFEN
jgi:hypothetical protein